MGNKYLAQTYPSAQRAHVRLLGLPVLAQFRTGNSLTALLARAVRVFMLFIVSFGAIAPAAAHNGAVHKGMAEQAYAIMRLADRMSRSNQVIGPPPEGASMAEWKKFHNDIRVARARLDQLAGVPAGELTGGGATDALREAAAAPDYNLDDTHLFVKPTSVLGMGAASKIADEAAALGLAAALIPIVCVGSCLASLIGLGGDTCKDCVKNAKNLADKVPTPSDITNLIPGIGDITDASFTGLWHFINIAPVGLVDNKYDDHQGMLYEQAGPTQAPGGIDLAIMAGTDIGGLSINPDKSDGVKHYEIASPGDAVPGSDTYDGSVTRGGAAWQKYPMGHTPFSPVDNLGLFGWRKFRDGDHNLGNLGFPLHAMGDATVPMHVTGTTGWGHRPYEEAHEHLWLDGDMRQSLSDLAIMQAAFKYRQQILAWRAAGHAGDTPVRGLIRAVARHTYEYSFQKAVLTAGDGPTKTWPFNDVASTLWHTFSEDDANKMYQDRTDAIDLGKPLLEDGIAAQIAFLVSASEASGIAQANQGQMRFAVYDPASEDAAFGAPKIKLVDDRRRRPPRRQTAADEQFIAALRMDYARLAQQFINGKLAPPDYLARVRDRSGKAALADADPTYTRDFARGDRDGDLIPDSRDASSDTPEFLPTDDRGRPRNPSEPAGPRGALPGPSTGDMRALFGKLNMLVAPECANQGATAAPRLQRLGYSNADRDLMFSVTPLSGATAKCPVFYEFGVRLTKVFPGNASFLPRETYREVVFRNDQSADLNPAGQNRLVFRIERQEAQTGDRDFLLQHVARYGVAQWRARAVNANGMSSPWSDWAVGATPISFEEP